MLGISCRALAILNRVRIIYSRKVVRTTVFRYDRVFC